MHSVDGEPGVSQCKDLVFTFSYIPDAVQADADIKGIAIDLPGGLDDDIIRTIFDATNMIASHASHPFVDNPIPQLSDGEEVVIVEFDEN